MKVAIAKPFTLLISALLTFGAQGNAQPKCSAQINRWGKPQQCSCPQGTTYQEFTGICVNGQVKTANVTIEGILRTGTMAIGGETTGVVLRSTEGKEDQELLFSADQQQRLETLSNKKIRIQGRTFQVYSPERRTRTIVAVDAYQLLESK